VRSETKGWDTILPFQSLIGLNL